MSRSDRITVTASHVRPTETGVEGAMDVDVEIEADGCEMSGEVTLVWAPQNSEWSSWGSRGHWVSSDLLRILDSHLAPSRVRDVLAEVAAVAGEACAVRS